MKHVNVIRNHKRNRYEIAFTQKNDVTWTRYLDDEVYEDPIRFAIWMRTLVEDLDIRR